MFDSCVIRGRSFAPARFCAPLAGFTHSAFRRLLAEFGGTGAVWTEMLAGRQILREDFQASPWLRRRPEEKNLVYQLMIRPGDPLPCILDRLGENGVEAVDLNLACDAMSIRACEAGSALFENLEGMREVVTEMRRHWPGIFTVKIRLGGRRPDWEHRFLDRLKIIEDAGVDALTLHPRFFEDKFKRRARHELVPWATSRTRLPIIANGDLAGAGHVTTQAEHLSGACAIMIGRMAIVRPWIFASWNMATPCHVDLAETWHRMLRFIEEDFEPAIALRRMQMFTKYFAANFAFGHRFYHDIANAPSIGTAKERAAAFFSRVPATVSHPVVAGL